MRDFEYADYLEALGGGNFEKEEETLNAEQMAHESQAYRFAEAKRGIRFPTWRAIDTALKTRPIRLLWPNPVVLSESELWVQTRNFSGAYSRIVEKIDLTAPDADARLARYDETASA